MNFDRKTLVAMAACFALYVGYTQYLQKKYPNMSKPASQVETETPTATTSSATSTAPATTAPALATTDAAPAVTMLSPEQLRFETASAVYEVDQQTAALKSVKLKKYRATKDSPADDWVEILDAPLALQPTLDVSQETRKQGFGAERQGQSLILTRQQGDWLTRETITFPQEGYSLDIKTEFVNTSAAAQDLTAGLWFAEVMKPKKGSGSFFIPASSTDRTTLISYADGSRSKTDLAGFCKKDETSALSLDNQNVGFVGFDNHYFLTVLQPKSEKINVRAGKAKDAGEGCSLKSTAYQNFGAVQPGNAATMNFGLYVGPKDVEVLKAHDKVLRDTVDFGWFSVIAYPLLVAVKWVNKITHNYGLAIILVTIALKLIFFPLTRSAAVSMKRMQKLNPQMQSLRERYKDDPRRQQQELMMFMSKNKVNPAKGCLPILPQIPVFIAFYNVLSQSIELRHSEFFGWIKDLSAADPYYITPLALGVLMFVQQKLTPNTTMDKNQEKIMMMLPIMFTVMMLSLPAGMVLYMITNTVVSILQQHWLNKRLSKLDEKALQALA